MPFISPRSCSPEWKLKGTVTPLDIVPDASRVPEDKPTSRDTAKGYTGDGVQDPRHTSQAPPRRGTTRGAPPKGDHRRFPRVSLGRPRGTSRRCRPARHPAPYPITALSKSRPLGDSCQSVPHPNESPEVSQRLPSRLCHFQTEVVHRDSNEIEVLRLGLRLAPNRNCSRRSEADL